MRRAAVPYLLAAVLLIFSSPSFSQMMYADLSGSFVLSNFAAESEAEPDWGLMAAPNITFKINPSVELGFEVTYTNITQFPKSFYNNSL